MTYEVRTHDGDYGHFRSLLRDGREVSKLVVVDRLARILGMEVPVAGIGGVATPPEHRMKGYARRLLEDTVDHMIDSGRAVSMLFGLPDFYDRYGFASCIPEYWTTTAADTVRRFGPPETDLRARAAVPEDFPSVVALYNEQNRLRSPAIVRDADRFGRFRKGTQWDTEADACVFADAAGHLAAYVVVERSATEVKVVEAQAEELRTYLFVLRHLGELAAERGASEIEIHLPPDHPMVVLAGRFGCVSRVRRERMGGGMMRVLRQDDLFDALRPAMRDRLAASRFAESGALLALETDLGATEVALPARSGQAPVRSSVRLPQQTLMQVVVGYRPAWDVLAKDDVEATGPAQELLEALFGGQVPYVYRADMF
jgi:predicted acetyltransferase